MLKRLLLAAVALAVLVGAGLYFWAHAIFASDAVRMALERQMSRTLGQPVHIGRSGATIVPRVTLTLGDVTIGEPARVTAASVHVGADLGALFSRRIEHGVVRLTGARIEMPLALPAPPASPAPDAAASGSIDIASIDAIVLSDVTIVSGGRTLHGDVDVAPDGDGFIVRRLALQAEGTSIDVTGRIATVAGPTGELTVAANDLNVGDLVAFLSDFSSGTGFSGRSQTAAAPPPSAAAPMRLAVTLSASRARIGTLALDQVTGRALITPAGVAVEPVRFGVFGGTYDGTLNLSLADTPDFRLHAALADVDLASAMTFAGAAGAVTGTLDGRLDAEGTGLTAGDVIRTLRGTARVDVTDGTVKNLGLVRTLVLAGSMRADSQREAAQVRADEPFSRLGATFTIGGGRATTDDLGFESPDLVMSGNGGFGLDGRGIDIAARVQLSKALSAQAGHDLIRYTQKDGLVTLPVTITGEAGALHVGIDAAGVARRAIVNRAGEEAKKAISKGLGGLLGR
jgi:uncharacterized protein involved in outer membrane biogenesis